MKKINNILKSSVILLSWFIIFLQSIIIVSCNSSTQQNTKKEEVPNEIQHMNEVEDDNLVFEKEKLKTEVDSVLNDFDKQLFAYENELQQGSTKNNPNNEEPLIKLKAKRDVLRVHIGEIEKQDYKNWQAFKAEFRHNTQQFSSGVKEFFQNNK